MSAETAAKPELPSTNDRHKIDLAAEVKAKDADKAEPPKSDANGKESKDAPVKSAFDGKDELIAHDSTEASLEPLGSYFAAADSKSKDDDKSMADGAPNGKSSFLDSSAQTPVRSVKEMESKQPAKTEDTDGEFFTAQAERPSNGAETSDRVGKSLEDDFEELEVTEDSDYEDKTIDSGTETEQEQKKRSDEPSHTGSFDTLDRPGVTKSIPVRLHEQLARKSMSSELSDSLPESRSVASAQRSSSAPKSMPSVELPDDHGVFTEESLHSAERAGADARPMSPAPVASTNFPDASTSVAVEPEEYKGLVYYDGVDSMGRPVVIINADALPRSASRKAAVTYLLQRLEPIIIQGPYVAIFLNTGEKSGRNNRLPAGWLASCYRQMSYPFKKNVKHVILVRPSFALNFMLRLMSPLISKKAHVKIKKVENLSALEAATNSEVTLQHLGPRFNTIAAQSIIAGEGPTYGQGAAYQMPNL